MEMPSNITANSEENYWMNRTDLPLEIRMYNARPTESPNSNAAIWAAVNKQVYDAVRSGGTGTYGSPPPAYSSYSSASQWNPLGTPPSSYNEQNMQYWNDLLQSLRPQAPAVATWGPAEDRRLRQNAQALASPYINAYRNDLNDLNARMIGQMGYANPYQAKYAMSAKTGELGTNISKTLATAAQQARESIQRDIDAQNQANRLAYQSQMAAYQALLDAIKRRT